jgi:hypothetical protein
MPAGKSFLLLFFNKEGLSFFEALLAKRRRGAA